MARDVAPGTPTQVNPVNVPQQKIDLSAFEKAGDAKIKSAMQNFELYATTTANAESQKLFNQYSANPIALANALSKLPQMFEDLPESIQIKMREKLDKNAISLVSKAQANQEKAIAEQNKRMAHANSDLLHNQIADDYFNVLRNITAPESEKRPIDDEIYLSHRQQLTQLADLTDQNGNFLFSESKRDKMLMPKEATVAGFRNFIYRPELKQLEQWDKDIFQNRDKFIKDTGIDEATYDSMDNIMKQRINQLKKDNERKVKAQAMFDTASLIKDPNNQAKIDYLRSNPNVPTKLVDKAVKLNESIIKSHWYDPTITSDPTGSYDVLAVMGNIASNTDTTPETLEKKIEVALNVLDQTRESAAKYNTPEDDFAKTQEWIADVITDQSFAQNIQMLDITPWIQGIVNAHKADIMQNPAEYGVKGLEKFEETQTAYHSKGKLSPLEKKAEESILKTQQHGATKRSVIQTKAYEDAKQGIFDTIIYLRQTGDAEGAKSMLDKVKYDYVKTYNSYWIPASTFDKLQTELEAGKKPMYFHNGIQWEYQGYQNNGAIFKVKL